MIFPEENQLAKTPDAGCGTPFRLNLTTDYSWLVTATYSQSPTTRSVYDYDVSPWMVTGVTLYTASSCPLSTVRNTTISISQHIHLVLLSSRPTYWKWYLGHHGVHLSVGLSVADIDRSQW